MNKFCSQHATTLSFFMQKYLINDHSGKAIFMLATSFADNNPLSDIYNNGC